MGLSQQFKYMCIITKKISVINYKCNFLITFCLRSEALILGLIRIFLCWGAKSFWIVLWCNLDLCCNDPKSLTSPDLCSRVRICDRESGFVIASPNLWSRSMDSQKKYTFLQFAYTITIPATLASVAWILSLNKQFVWNNECQTF